jgi:hypothetical protein
MMHWVAQGNQRAFEFMFGGGRLSWDNRERVGFRRGKGWRWIGGGLVLKALYRVSYI